jgi:hypothetical protein
LPLAQIGATLFHGKGFASYFQQPTDGRLKLALGR